MKNAIGAVLLLVKLNKRDCNWTRTHNHLVRKRTLNHLAKNLLIKHLNILLIAFKNEFSYFECFIFLNILNIFDIAF